MESALLQVMKHKMTINLDVFDAHIEDIIVSNLKGTMIVTIDRDARL